MKTLSILAAILSLASTSLAQVATNDHRTAVFRWTSVSGAASYRFRWRPITSTNWTILTNAIPTNTFTTKLPTTGWAAAVTAVSPEGFESQPSKEYILRLLDAPTDFILISLEPAKTVTIGVR